jgi:hypothetical protein
MASPVSVSVPCGRSMARAMPKSVMVTRPPAPRTTLEVLKSRGRPGVVRRVEPGGHRLDEGQGGVGGEAAVAPEACGQRLAVEELHGEEGDRLVLGEVEDADDRRVGHLARELDLALEPLGGARVAGGHVGAQRLQRHVLARRSSCT